MDGYKNKTIRNLEEKIESVDENTLRHHILENAKNFKTSWIELGRALYTVFRDKLFKEWGYSNFDIYTTKEIGIRKQTAMKLLRSYYFLEKEEPGYLKKDYVEAAQANVLPSYEAVDVLRQAKNKKVLDEKDYSDLKKNIFEKGKDAREIKKDLTSLIRQREELEPEEAWEKKKFQTLRRFLGALRSITEEIKTSKLTSASIIKDAEELIQRLESEIN